MEDDKKLIGIDLSTASKDVIELLIEETTDYTIFEEIISVNKNRLDIMKFLLEHPDTPEHIKQQLSHYREVPAKEKPEVAKEKKHPEERAQSILQRLQKLTVSERILLALRGNKEVRTMLLRDTNKEVVMTVLDNPKITDTEIEILSKSRSVSEEVLRKITKKREWMKNYAIISSLVSNPKTPTPIAIKLVSDLKTRDLSIIEKNKNVSEGVRAMAKKLVRARKAH
jgi:hypothetical protein